MKIAFIADISDNGGGKAGRNLRLIQGLNKIGITEIILIIINNCEVYPEIKETSTKVYILDRHNKGTVKTTWNLFKILNEFKPDVIQVWHTYLSSILIDFYALFHRFVYVSSYIADCFGPKTFLQKTIHSLNGILNNCFVGNSQAGIDAYKVPLKKSFVVYNGFNFETIDKVFIKEEIKNKLKIRTPYVITMIAVMKKDKDYDTYLKTAQQIIKERKDITFLCVGGGPLLEHYKALYSCSSNICFLGFRRDISQILTITDISILSTFTEGISNSIMESMAMGVPVIASDGGGTKEIVEDGINGFLVPIKSISSLKHKINLLLSNDDLRCKMGINALKTIKTKFSLDRMVDEFVQIYERYR